MSPAIKQTLFLFLGATLSVIVGLGYYACRSIKEHHSIHTARNARPQDVSFLNLPENASRIGYWRDGVNSLAAFEIPEDAFRRLFPEFQFREITEPPSIYPKVFGNPLVYPTDVRTRLVIVSSGLKYNSRWSNGGGYNIVFDRSQSRAYYDFAKY